MHARIPLSVRLFAVLLPTAAWLSAPTHAQEPNGYVNLHVLPEDISRNGLIEVMFENEVGLGLPRRANEGCLFCHVGSMAVPSREWDFASDDNPMKVKARAMMAMVEDINGRWLAGIDATHEMEVTCATCHAGRTNPLPLPELLRARHAEGGVDALVSTYVELRSRYFASDAYDFRVPVLSTVAADLARDGFVAAAVRVHELNIQSNDDPSARHGLIRLRLSEALDENGIEGMVARYHEEKRVHPVEAFTAPLLSPLAWTLFRGGREEAGYRLFELNYEEHPDSYTATEDLAWGMVSVGDVDRGIAQAEAWLTRNPGHALGERLVEELRSAGR